MLQEKMLKPIEFEFHGKAGEYFRIWIVNILLTIVTLGIYSAWAKVRNKRYFYGNTLLDNSPFEYTASPIAILKGRLVVAAVLIVYSITARMFPISEGIFFVLFLLVLPWLVMRSFMFNARYSNYRNLYFRFENNLSGAVKVFLGLGVIVPLSVIAFGYLYFLLFIKSNMENAGAAWIILVLLGMLLLFAWYVFYMHAIQAYRVDNHGFGQLSFRLHKALASFYKHYLFGILIFIAGLIVIGLIFWQTSMQAFFGLGAGADPDLKVSPIVTWSSIVMTVLYVIVYFYVYAYIRAKVFNTVWTCTSLNKQSAYVMSEPAVPLVAFKGNLKPWDLFVIYITNTIGIILSVGLLIPWAKIRLARYRINNLAVSSIADLKSITAVEREKVGTIGSEMGDILDIDIGW